MVDTVTSRRDGRHLRGDRTRQRIIDATRMLMHDGVWQPPVAGIARLAGVSPRSIFQHFDDTRSLFAVALKEPAITRMIARQILPAMELAVPDHVAAELYSRVAHAAVIGRPSAQWR